MSDSNVANSNRRYNWAISCQWQVDLLTELSDEVNRATDDNDDGDDDGLMAIVIVIQRVFYSTW